MTEKRFKHKWNMLGIQFICYDDKEVLIGTFADKDGLSHITELLNNFDDENEQLKQRNDRQAKQLAELYELMAKKDWESLTEIIDDFKRCEEQLQREWRTYE